MPQDGMPKRDMPHDCMPNYWTAVYLTKGFVKVAPQSGLKTALLAANQT